MKTVWKATFEISDTIRIVAPPILQIVKVDKQGDENCIWFLCQSHIESREHKFHIRGTGHDCSGTGEHIATWFDGPFVWHLFKGE